MQIQRLDPRALVKNAVTAAEKAVGQKATLSAADVAALPAALQQVAQSITGQVTAKDLVGAYQKALEKTLGSSLQTGAFVAAESAKALDLVAFSPVAVQLSQALVEQSRPKTAGEADVVAQTALRGADTTVASQVALHKALVAASDLHKKENPKSAASKDLATAVKAREKLLKKSVDETVKHAEQALKAGTAGAKEALVVAIGAALDVYKAVSPKSSRIQTLEKKLKDLGSVSLDRAQGLPFFARFLESQAQPGQMAPKVGSGDIGQMVTMKFPSDSEDSGDGDGGVSVTKKFPSDAEDTGGDVDGGVSVTKKFPSDAEDTGGDVGGGGISVTMKYPSDNEDGAGDVDGTDRVTRKFPSDNEDGGGDTGGVHVTMKYPSDNEDGAGGGDPIAVEPPVTRKFPSDNEDGGGEVGGPGTIVTRKFPSDHEDGGGEVGGPGGVGGVTPPVTDPATALKRRTIDVEERVNTLMLAGPAAMEQRASDIGDLLVRARLEPEAFATLTLEKEALHTMCGGQPVLDEKIKGIEKLLMTALIAPEEHQTLTAELGFYKDLKADFSSQKARIGELDKKKQKTPAETAERAVLKLFVDGGIKPLSTRYEQLLAQLDSSTTKPPLELTLERSAIKAFLNGDVWMKNRIVEIDDFMSRAMMSPEAVTAHSQEKQLLENLRAGLKPFASRANELKAALAEIDGVTPPDVDPRVGTNKTALALEGGVMKSMWHGMAGVDARFQDLVRTLAPGSTGNAAIELRVLQAAREGVPGLTERVASIEHTLQVARLLEPARKEMELELTVTKAVLADTAELSGRVDSLSRRRHRTPTEELELAILKVGVNGYDALNKRIADIDDLMTRARFTPEGMEKIQLERAGLKAYLNGGQVLRDRVTELEYIMATSRMTQEAKQKLDGELALNRALLSSLEVFEKRAMAIGELLAA